MLRFEERFTCKDATGESHVIEVYVNVGRENGQEVLGRREAFLVGGPTQVKLNSIEGLNVFQVPGGGMVLRRVKG